MAEDGRLTLIVDANIDQAVNKLNQAGSNVAGFSTGVQRQIDALKSKIDPLAAAANKMGKEIDQASKLLQLGAISAGEHAAAVDLAKASYDRFAESVNKTAIAEALESTIARSRIAVLEEGSTKIPIFAGALEALGPAGLAVAAAIAAMAIAGEEAKKSLEFAEQIDSLSKSLGVSTTELQAFDYATSGTAVGIDKGREALKSFNEVFGKYSAGLANGRTAKFLDALGFTPESARQIDSTTDALDKALTALSKLQNPQQRAALANQLGLSEFLPVIAEGQEGIEKFTASMKAAQAAGAIIPADEIKRGAELNDQLNQINHTISIEVKEAFIALGPVILDVAKLIERAASGASALAQAFAGIEHTNRANAGAAANDALGYRNAVYATGLAGTVDSKTGRASGGVLSAAYNAHQDHYDAANQRIAQIDAQGKLKTSSPGADLSQPKKPRAATPDPFTEENKTAAQDLAQQSKNLDTALAALTSNIDDHADFERKAVQDELAKENAKLDAEETLAKTKKGLSDGERAQLVWTEEETRLKAQDVADAKTAKITRDAITAQEAKSLQQYLEINGYYDAILQTAIGLARTSAERQKLELQLLAQQKAEADKTLATARAKDVRDDPAHADGINSYYDSKQASANDKYASDIKKTIKDTQGPLDKWKDGATQSAAEVQEALENAAVKGFDAFNSGAADAIANGKSLGDVMHTVFKQMETDLISYLLKQSEIGLLNSGFGFGSIFSGLAGLFGGAAAPASTLSTLDLGKQPIKLAGGGYVPGAGGPTSDNIPALLSPGEFVLSNDMLRSMRSMSPPSARAPAAPVLQFDLRGAVMTDDLLRQMQTIGQQAAAAGTVNGGAIGSANAQASQARRQARLMGLGGR